jgi:hypothetical protein
MAHSSFATLLCRLSPRRICLCLLTLGNLARSCSFLIEITTADPLAGRTSFKVYVAHSLPDCFFLSLYTFVVLYLFRTYAMVLGRGSKTIGCHPALWLLNVGFYVAFVAFSIVSLMTELYDWYRVVVQYFIGAVYTCVAVAMLRLLVMVHFSLANPKVFTTSGSPLCARVLCAFVHRHEASPLYFPLSAILSVRLQDPARSAYDHQREEDSLKLSHLLKGT